MSNKGSPEKIPGLRAKFIEKLVLSQSPVRRKRKSLKRQLRNSPRTAWILTFGCYVLSSDFKASRNWVEYAIASIPKEGERLPLRVPGGDEIPIKIITMTKKCPAENASDSLRKDKLKKHKANTSLRNGEFHMPQISRKRSAAPKNLTKEFHRQRICFARLKEML